jgi:ankyrin repeat protein
VRKKAFWILGGILGVFLVPWVFVCAVFVADDVSRDLALRRYRPTSLADAVTYKYATPEMVARFIDQGADVNQKVPGANGAAPIPLIAAASASNNVDVARLLLHRGARIGDANLWSRARNGNEAMARMLIEEGASLGRQPDYEEGIGPELLQAAAFGGQAWLVRLIVQKGGDVQVVTAFGDGLLGLALQSEYHETLETAKALLAAGAHVNPLTSGETPPLYWAAYNGKLEEMDLLLAAGARAEAPVARAVLKDLVLPPGVSVTPLSVAVERCHYEAADRLLRRGASKSAVIYDGKSLMEGACYHKLDSDKARRERMRPLLAR